MSKWKQFIPTNLEDIFGDDYGCQLLYRELIYRSANKDGFVTYKKKTTPIKRGQVVFGRHQWSLYLQQNGSTLRNWLTKLEKVYNLVDNQSNNNFTIVTIKDYDNVTFISNQLNNHVTTSSQPANTSKSVKSVNNIKEKNSKNSHVPCTQEELEEIALSLRVDIRAVKKIEQEILENVEIKDHSVRNSKTTYNTLKKWVKNAISWNKIEQLSYSDAEDQVLLSRPVPPKIQAWFKELES